MAIAVQDALLGVAGMRTPATELEARFKIAQQMDMAALHIDAVGFQDLCETGKTVNGRSREDDALPEDFLQKIIEDLWRFLAGTKSSGEQACSHVPHKVFTVFFALDRECFAIEQENAVRGSAILKDRSC